MALTQLTTDLNIIQALEDEPNDVGGLSAAQLKAKFDEAANAIKTFLNNTLIAELEGDTGAPNIGIEAIAELTDVDNVQDALEGIIVMLQDVTQGAVADGSITTAKLANLSVATAKVIDAAITEAKLASNAVTTAKIVDLSVTAAKLAASAVETAKIADGAVTTDKIGAKQVTGAKIADLTIATQKLEELAVTTSKLANGAVATAKIADAAVTRAKLGANAVSDIYTATITATWTGSAAPYSQTISVTGLLASDTPVIDIVPDDTTFATAEAQLDAWAEIYRFVAGTDTLTVYSKAETTTAIPIQILCVRR